MTLMLRILFGWLGLIVLAFWMLQQVNAQTTPPLRLKIDTQSDPQTTGYPHSRKLVRDAQGNLYAAYRKKGADDAFHIFVARLPLGAQAWDEAQQVDNLAGFDQRVPSLTIDQAARLHLVWYGSSAQSQGKNDRQIFYAQAPARATGKLAWTRPLLLAGGVPGYTLSKTEPRLWQEHPVIHAAPNGRLYVAWEGKDAENLVKGPIKVTYSQDGGATWQPWQNITGEPNSYYSRPTLVASSDGQTVYVAAYATRRDQADTHLVWTQANASANSTDLTWQPWQFVTDQKGKKPCAGKQEQRQVSLVIDSADQLHAVWQEQVAEVLQICYARFGQGQWIKPQRVAADPAVYQAFPNITIDKDQRLWVVWNEFSQAPVVQEDGEPPTGTLRAAKQPQGGSWRPVDLTGLTAGRNALYPSLRWHRSPYPYGVDLIWVEREVTAAAAEASCFERQDEDQVRPLCTIYYANLAGL